MKAKWMAGGEAAACLPPARDPLHTFAFTAAGHQQHQHHAGGEPQNGLKHCIIHLVVPPFSLHPLHQGEQVFENL